MRFSFRNRKYLKDKLTKQKFLKRDKMDKIAWKRFHRQIQNGRTIEHSFSFRVRWCAVDLVFEIIWLPTTTTIANTTTTTTVDLSQCSF